MHAPLLEATSIRKAFAGVHALKGVHFELRASEVHALVGENGAGKSTLIKVITGAVQPDSGTLSLSGQVIPLMTPAVARTLGIAAIYQEPSLFPDLSVTENIAMALETGGMWRLVHWRARKQIALELIARAGGSIDPDRVAETLSMPEQQIVEIAKVIGANAKVVIMDEPTSSLTEREVESLFQVIGTLRTQGAGIIYISHRLDEISRIADRISVLRDGENIATRPASEVHQAELIEMMVGRPVSSIFPKRSVTLGPVALELKNVANLSLGVRNISLSVQRGEIFGLAGLAGSGRSELAETIFGLTPADSGEILLNGESVRISSPAEAIQHWIAYVPEDRRKHGLVLEMPILANTSLASLWQVSRRGLIQPHKEEDLAKHYLGQLRIKAASVNTITATLSGGNQQKVALARWLAIQPSVLILDEPTQGVDVGSKAEIHSLMMDLAERGIAILLISSELPELLGICDRIAVMHQGTIRRIVSRAEATQQSILALAMGTESP